jgi:hypothetical protein
MLQALGARHLLGDAVDGAAAEHADPLCALRAAGRRRARCRGRSSRRSRLCGHGHEVTSGKSTVEEPEVVPFGIVALADRVQDGPEWLDSEGFELFVSGIALVALMGLFPLVAANSHLIENGSLNLSESVPVAIVSVVALVIGVGIGVALIGPGVGYVLILGAQNVLRAACRASVHSIFAPTSRDWTRRSGPRHYESAWGLDA